MKFECDNCGASYKIADEKVGDRGVKVRCKKCEHVIIVRPAEEGASPDETSVGQEPIADDTQQDAPAAAAGGDSVFGTDEGQRDPAWDEPTKVGGEGPADLMAMAAQQSQDEAAAGDSGSADDAGGADDVFGASDESVDNVFGGGEDAAATDESEQADDDADGGGFAGSVSPELAAEAERMAAEQSGADPLGPPTGDDDEETSLDLSGPGGGDATEQDGGVAAAEAAALAALGGLDEAPPPEPVPSPFSEEQDDQAAGAPDDAGEDEGVSLGSFDDEEETAQDQADVPDPLAAMGGEGFGDEAPEPPGPDDGLGMPEPPAPDALSMPAADEGMPAVDAGAMPAGGMPDPDATGSEGLDLQLEGAFSNMFGQLPDGDPNEPVPEPAPLADPFAAGGAPNPTALINMDEMDQLRNDAMPSDAGDALGGGPDEDTDGWHVAIDDEDHGPMLLSEVKQHIQRGDVDPESLVWRSGMPDWSAARDVPELASLFSQLPMPSLSQLDVGAPIDDVSSSPFGGQGGGGGGGDPFSQVPDAPGDPNWQPHGLTEVYAAANLAEAAGASVSIGTGGLGTGLAAEAPVEKPSGDGGGWSPGAASALQSLVNDELARIDEPADAPLTPADPGGLDLPPGSGLLAEAGINLDENSPGLDAGAAGPSPFGASASMPYAPATQSSAAFPAASASMPYAPPGGGQSMPFAGPPGTGSMSFVGPPGTGSMAFAPSPPPQARPAWVYPALIGGGLLGLLLVVSLVKIAFFGAAPDPATTVVAAAEPAEPTEPVGKTADPAPEPTKEPVGVASADNPPPADKPADAPAANGAADNAAASDDGSASEPPGDAKVASAAPVDKPAERREAKRAAAKKTKKTKKTRKTKTETKRTRDDAKKKKPEKKKTRRSSSKADCDPVLDFDCDDGGSKKKKVKDSLTKADILSVVKKKISRINSCGKKHGGSGKTVKVTWKVRKSGRTSDVKVVSSSVSGTPLGRCLTKEVKRWRFPAFRSGSAKPITFPFKLK